MAIPGPFGAFANNGGVIRAFCWRDAGLVSPAMLRIRIIADSAISVRWFGGGIGRTVFRKIKHLRCGGPYGPVCT